jgi:hypothetical protein
MRSPSRPQKRQVCADSWTTGWMSAQAWKPCQAVESSSCENVERIRTFGSVCQLCAQSEEKVEGVSARPLSDCALLRTHGAPCRDGRVQDPGTDWRVDIHNTHTQSDVERPYLSRGCGFGRTGVRSNAKCAREGKKNFLLFCAPKSKSKSWVVGDIFEIEIF